MIDENRIDQAKKLIEIEVGVIGKSYHLATQQPTTGQDSDMLNLYEEDNRQLSVL